VNYITGTTPSQPWRANISVGGSAGPPFGLGGLAQRNHRSLEVRRGLEALVDRGEAQIRDRVQDLEALQDAEAQTLAPDLGATGSGFLLDLSREGFDGLGSDGAAGDGPVDASDELGALEGLAFPGALHHHERELDDPLLGREPASAGKALASAADRGTVVGGTGIDNLVVVGQAERAAHPVTVTLPRLQRDGAGGIASRREAEGLTRGERPGAVDRGEGVDDGPGVVVWPQPAGDAPQGVSGSYHDGVRGGEAGAALGSCEG
jgi:hypothetical protein